MAFPSSALATSVIVPPLVASNVDPAEVVNMTSLIAAELEFSGRFDEVEQLEMLPKELDVGCLRSASCLGKVAGAQSASTMVAGSVTGKGRNLQLMLVYFDEGRVVREKSLRVPNVPAFIADTLGPAVNELVTGESSRDKAEAASMGLFDDVSTEELLDDVTDLEIDPEPPIVEGGDDAMELLPERGAGVGVTESTAIRSSTNMDTDEISFGTTASMIEVEEADGPSGEADGIDTEELDLLPEPAGRLEESLRQDASAEADGGDDARQGPPRLTLAIRGGYAPYQSLHYSTFGVEAALRFSPSGAFFVGSEAYVTRRLAEADAADALGVPEEQWNVVIPFNLGVRTQVNDERVRPYAGAEVVFVPWLTRQDDAGAGTVDSADSNFALGGRARFGVDIALTRHVGLTGSAALGVLSSRLFPEIQSDLDTTAFVYQVSSGLVFGI